MVQVRREMADQVKQELLETITKFRQASFDIGGPMGNAMSKAFDFLFTIVRDGMFDENTRYSLESMGRERELAMSRDPKKDNPEKSVQYGLIQCLGLTVKHLADQSGRNLADQSGEKGMQMGEERGDQAETPGSAVNFPYLTGAPNCGGSFQQCQSMNFLQCTFAACGGPALVGGSMNTGMGLNYISNAMAPQDFSPFLNGTLAHHTMEMQSGCPPPTLPPISPVTPAHDLAAAADLAAAQLAPGLDPAASAAAIAAPAAILLPATEEIPAEAAAPLDPTPAPQPSQPLDEGVLCRLCARGMPSNQLERHLITVHNAASLTPSDRPSLSRKARQAQKKMQLKTVKVDMAEEDQNPGNPAESFPTRSDMAKMMAKVAANGIEPAVGETISNHSFHLRNVKVEMEDLQEWNTPAVLVNPSATPAAAESFGTAQEARSSSDEALPSALPTPVDSVAPIGVARVNFSPPRPFICSQCDQSSPLSAFETQRGLRMHESSFPGQPCDQCAKRLKDEKALEKHRKKVHCKRPLTNEGLDEGARAYVEENPSKKAALVENAAFPCDQCTQTFDSSKGLNRHRVIHNGTECPFCEKKIASGGISHHLEKYHSEKEPTAPRKTSVRPRGLYSKRREEKEKELLRVDYAR